MEKYILKLTEAERTELHKMVSTGKAAAYKLTHARILLACDKGEHNPEDLKDREIAERLYVNESTVRRVRKRCVLEGLEAALSRKRRSRERSKALSGEEEARLITLACSTPPEGCARWTLKLLAEKLVSLEIVQEVSPSTVGRTLKKMNLNHG